MKPAIKTFSIVFLLLAFFVSCTKEKVAINTPSGKSLLMAHTWQLEEVTELVAGKTIVVYKRSQERNADDFALVRQSFKEDGSILFVDQFGNTGNDGEYELNADGSKIKLSLGAEQLAGEQVLINAQSFAYTVKLSEEDAVQYRFTPVF
jgi:hypothetical protein